MPLVRRREPFDDPAWLLQVKLDGFRALMDSARQPLITRSVELDRRHGVRRAGRVRVRLRVRLGEAVDRDGIPEERKIALALRPPDDMDRVWSSAAHPATA